VDYTEEMDNMQALEKILEEIEERVNIVENIPVNEDDDFLDGEECYEDGRVQGRYEELVWCRGMIHSHMDDATDTNDGWILVEDGLPEEHDSIFAKFKGTDMWSNAMFEKSSDKVNVTFEFEDGTRKSGTSYTIDGKWKCEKGNCAVKRKVIAWRPLPEPYKPKKDLPAAGNEQIYESGVGGVKRWTTWKTL
jgi:hypothetical protein